MISKYVTKTKNKNVYAKDSGSNRNAQSNFELTKKRLRDPIFIDSSILTEVCYRVLQYITHAGYQNANKKKNKKFAYILFAPKIFPL